MQTQHTLAEAYRKLEMIGERFGPHLICRPGTDDERQLRKLSEENRALFQKAAMQREEIDERRWRVPSAHHALLILRGTEEVFLRKGASLRPIYRGQSHTFDPIPSFFRPGTNQAAEEHIAEMFCSLLEQLLNGGHASEAVRKSYLAIAQHYGIRTRLLDFTPDPAVAVYFAAKGPPTPHGEAVVYSIAFNKMWKFGGRIYLVPAFAERVYLQRGLFVEIPEAEMKTFRLSCFEIRFPHDPEFCIQRHGQKVDILREDPWLANAIAWSRERVRQGESVPDDPGERIDFWDTVLLKLGYPSFAYADSFSKMMSTAQWVDNISDLLYWLVLTIRGQQELLDPAALRMMAQDNSETLLEFADEFEIEARLFENTGQRQGREKLCKLIRQSVFQSKKPQADG
jgi:hypothetical protein